jgi:AraC family transcriptional regulator, regulatory protein of adaptative response / methylated-DNA-[protein]-cysteine methyltransferase
MSITFTISESSLGKILTARSDKGVCCIMLDNNASALKRELKRRFPKAELIEKKGADKTVTEFIEKPMKNLDMPLDLQGTPFQKKVWDALRKVPFGKTATYADIAKKIGKPTAARAVAQACGANHVALAVPCHRIVRSDGSLSGYRWGVNRKAALLAREAEPRG